MADWGKSQLDVRLTHVFDPNVGKINEEASHVTVEGDTLVADMFLETEALAADSYATFTDAAVTAWLLPDTDDGRSFVDYHECGHDGLATPCTLAASWPT